MPQRQIAFLAIRIFALYAGFRGLISTQCLLPSSFPDNSQKPVKGSPINRRSQEGNTYPSLLVRFYQPVICFLYGITR